MEKSNVIKLSIVATALLASVGCSTHYYKPVCRHTAVMAALTAGEKHPVRLAWGKNPDHWQNHVQAQAEIDGKWECLNVVGGAVEAGSCDNYQVYQYFTIKEFIDFEWKTGVE
jgi:hypothetical protein